MTWLLNLFAPILWYLGIPLPQRYNLYFLGAGVTVVDNPSKGRTDITIAGAPTSGAFGSQPVTLGTQVPPQYQLQTTATVLTTDGSTATLWSTFVTGSTYVVAEALVLGWISTAAHVVVYIATGLFAGVRIGSGAMFSGSSSVAAQSPALPFDNTSGNPGSAVWSASGNNIVLSVVGVVATAWAPTTAYAVGRVVTNVGNTYLAVANTGDTHSAGSGGPTGGGPGIVDNHVTWDFLAAGTAVPITWCACKAEIFTT